MIFQFLWCGLICFILGYNLHILLLMLSGKPIHTANDLNIACENAYLKGIEDGERGLSKFR